jgi:hypothetical protein
MYKFDTGANLMTGYEEKSRNTSLNLMAKRLGVEVDDKNQKKIQSITSSNLVGIENQAVLLGINGGFSQQDRMIYDKRRSLDRALKYSYQAANIKADVSDKPIRCLINPDKLKQDYDDKIISVHKETGLKPGDIFEWLGTNTHWLIYLQDLTELAYFRGDIRRCSYEIAWEDEDGYHSTYAAVKGPVETKINYIQKHDISIDTPNYSLNILLPRTEAISKYFRRYSKFYLQGTDEGSPQVCWRVEATDWISTPGILEVNAVEYYINETEDDLEKGLVGGLIVKPESPNTEAEEIMISGETFIKPKRTYEYTYSGLNNGQWSINKKYPITLKVDEKNPLKVYIKWNSSFSGEFDLTFGNFTKKIIVESLF